MFMPITIEVVNLIRACGEVYSIQHVVTLSDLWQVHVFHHYVVTLSLTYGRSMFFTVM
jgi:hypothetical protein